MNIGGSLRTRIDRCILFIPNFEIPEEFHWQQLLHCNCSACDILYKEHKSNLISRFYFHCKHCTKCGKKHCAKCGTRKKQSKEQLHN